MRKSITALTVITLALATLLTFGLTGKNSANATTTTRATTQSLTIPTGLTLVALTDENKLEVLVPGATSFTTIGRVSRASLDGGYLIGIDYRVADGKVYGLTDKGGIYTINITNPPTATFVSSLSPRFAGGFQSLMDFNPVVNAVRLIGGNDQNFAVVNGTGNLATTAVQTAVAYAAGDVNSGQDPNIVGGTYTNDFVGATSTIFYALDFDKDTMVTIAGPLTATGSSNTGGGQLQTIGSVVDASGKVMNLSPTADCNIYTDANRVNYFMGVSGRQLFTINLAQISPTLALGQTKNVVANIVTFNSPEGMTDITYLPPAGAPAPTPTPTPKPTATPTPAPNVTLYEAEKALRGGGAIVESNIAGFTGTGFVNYADNVAYSWVEFAVTQTGTRTLVFRYGNGSTVNRTCSVTLNGKLVGTLSFAPTGSFGTYKTTSLSVNLGTTVGSKAVRVTSTTTAGGPNLDNLVVQ